MTRREFIAESHTPLFDILVYDGSSHAVTLGNVGLVQALNLRKTSGASGGANGKTGVGIVPNIVK